MVDKQNAYLKTQVMTARPEQLTLMLFDGALRFGEKARACLEARDFEGSFEAISRVEQIVMELLNGLRPDDAPELCRQQSGLYMFVYSKLVEANMRRDVAPLMDALQVLGILRETWRMLMEKIAETVPEDGGPARPVPAPASMSLEG